MVIAQKSIELEKGRVLADLARQVSHDIQSPLSVLNLITYNLDIPSEKLSLMKASVQRINEITDSMLITSRNIPTAESKLNLNNFALESGIQTTVIVPLVESLILEKKTEFRAKTNVTIELEVADTDLISNISGTNLSRLLSNLINNAVEAIILNGRVKVCLRASEDYNVITISDNGMGIAGDVMKEIGHKGVSIGKKGGNGLGLFNAKLLVAECGGQFEIHSVSGSGTLVTVKLPRIIQL